jgi:hypothetical protein
MVVFFLGMPSFSYNIPFCFGVAPLSDPPRFVLSAITTLHPVPFEFRIIHP